ncbi:BamA/TamA family outer membrane protein [Microcoleus sp. PH2017_28_MFU_U_A]|uniref:BamA/TamA family outer membrane protein n=1 Tax=Microcoleus sp. PH2017_28_MFU_U_A TaxID=2798838 RepID=UPI001E16C56D|nr:BamA/TamA family outer membrane protein [Microcoleus sp. PH2017_28_MFU_U_A]MCC3590625.1 BamA/TamA family outer membrane protein [Microcoleus sp. PH2017_28_MFU_U_A]
MRLSAVLVAVFTVSATFGLSNSASGQTSYSESTEEALAAVPSAPSIELPDRPVPELTQNSPQNRTAANSSPAAALKIAAAPRRGEDDREPPNRVTDPVTPVSPAQVQLKPEIASNPVASSSQNALPEAQVASPLPPSETGVSPTWVAVEPRKQDESGAIVQDLQVSPKPAQDESGAIVQNAQIPPRPAPARPAPTRPAPTRPPANTLPTLPSGPGTPQPRPAPAPAGAAEPQVLVAEVTVTGATGDLASEIYRVISTQPGRTTNRSQLQQDINAIFATGFFRNVRAVPEDTPLGVRVSFIVQPNPVLRGVTITGQQVLPQSVIDDSFRDQYGKILNLRRFEEGVKKINAWYQENGYVLGQITDAPQVADDGTVTLVVAEGQIESVDVRFLNKEGEATDATGQTIGGNTRRYVITREVQLKPGDIFNRTKAERDLRRVFGLGIFEDVRLALEPGTTDPRKARVIVNVIEKNTGSLAAGAGLSSATGLFGTVSYQQQNLNGRNQKLGAEVQIGERQTLFDLSFTDPWIAGDPYRTSFTANIFRRRSISVIFDGGEREVRLANDDRPRIVRTGGGINFTRPLSRDPFADSEWTASLGLQYQRVSITDRKGRRESEDALGNQLSFSNSGSDDLTTIQAGAVRDRRNDPLRPTSGSLLRFGMEQSIPVGSGSILLNRLRASYSFYLPVKYTNFTPGPQTLAFSFKAGTVFGDLPPYEAFALGGANSVRGYNEGEIGAGRSFLEGSVEYRFPIISFIGGALFLDAGTDLGTGKDVPGDPAGVRRKPGSGYGYGLGVRIQSPLGPIRIDYGINDGGDNQIHFGIGERF